MVDFVISFCGNRVSALGPPWTALHHWAGVQHLVSKQEDAIAPIGVDGSKGIEANYALHCVHAKSACSGPHFGSVCV